MLTPLILQASVDSNQRREVKINLEEGQNFVLKPPDLSGGNSPKKRSLLDQLQKKRRGSSIYTVQKNYIRDSQERISRKSFSQSESDLKEFERNNLSEECLSPLKEEEEPNKKNDPFQKALTKQQTHPNSKFQGRSLWSDSEESNSDESRNQTSNQSNQTTPNLKPSKSPVKPGPAQHSSVFSIFENIN